MNYYELIDFITKEVIRCLESNNTLISDNRKKLLVLGDIEKMSLSIDKSSEYDYLSINSYEIDGDIDKYSLIIITKLSNSQLCDIALGREDTPFTCAVQKALLTGKKVYLMESALAFRKFKDTSSSELYFMLEEYVQKLIKFGVIIKQEIILKDNYSSESNISNEYDSTEKIITNNVALDICKSKQKQVVFPKGTIITPLAKDVFLMAKTEIIIR